MKTTRTVTPAVLAANRANAKSSTGPRTEQGKSNTRRNAIRHGLLAKTLILKTDEEKTAFEDLLLGCTCDYDPRGVVETFLVEEVATLIWNIGIAQGLVARELALREEGRQGLARIFHSGELELPIDSLDLPIEQAWESERIVVRAAAGNDFGSARISRGPAVLDDKIVPGMQSANQGHCENGKRLEFEVVLGNSLDKVMRYQAALKRDLYRAIDTLHTMQESRAES